VGAVLPIMVAWPRCEERVPENFLDRGTRLSVGRETSPLCRLLLSVLVAVVIAVIISLIVSLNIELVLPLLL